MTVAEFPDRKINIEGVNYLYFGGTNYLGITTNIDFQTILFESIKKWGTSYGSSRNSNIKLSVFSTAEKLLAKNIGTEAALAVSSGMLAGKLVIEHLTKTSDLMFHFPDSHPAIISPCSLPITENGKLNSRIFDAKISKITVVTDAIPSLYVEPIDLSILLDIPPEKEITLVIDESHSLGIIKNKKFDQLSQKENFKIIKVGSLGKAMGLSGGLIAGKSSFITEIQNQDSFIGASGMNPAFLETYIKSHELYESQKQKLQENLNYIDTHFVNRSGFTFNASYPVIYFENELFVKKLLKNKIIVVSFKYTCESGKLNRIVITANHTIKDLEQLISQLNSHF